MDFIGKDVNLKILEELDDRDLFSFCLVDKYVNKICKDENFWRKRFLKRFKKRYDNDRTSWRTKYISVVKDLLSSKKNKVNPWDFFHDMIFANMRWDNGFKPNEIKSDFTFNNYYYLDLTKSNMNEELKEGNDELKLEIKENRENREKDNGENEVIVNFFTESDTYIPKKYKYLTPYILLKEINKFYQHRDFIQGKYFNGFLYLNGQYYLLLVSE